MSWMDLFWAAYQDGHNIRKLHGSRLTHYAYAYADVCEDVAYPMHLDFFYERWDAGEFYEGVADPGGEHWRVAS